MARGNLHVAGVCIRSICLDKHLFWGQVSPRRAPVPFTRPLTGRRDHWQANDPAFALFLSPYSAPGTLTLVSTAPGGVLADQNPACSARAWMHQEAEESKPQTPRLDICTMNERVFPP